MLSFFQAEAGSVHDVVALIPFLPDVVQEGMMDVKMGAGRSTCFDLKNYV